MGTYTRVVAIVHPLVLEIAYFEQRMRNRAEKYSLTLTDSDLNPFGKYYDRRKFIILPGRDGDISLPNTDLLTPRITLSQNDVAISDFNTYSSLVKDGVHPNWDRVVEKFIRKAGYFSGVIIVGGYSSGDCVENFALACDKVGLPTVMDEGMTELYYLAWPHTELLHVYNVTERPRFLEQRRQALRAKENLG